jgi:multicomponent Na+:H+ antiporter subunit C
LTVNFFYNLTGAGLFLLGFYSLFTQPRLLKKILSINICGAGLFLLMISTGFDPAGGPPDPVLQALVLTGIVIAVSVTAYGLALAGCLRPRGRKAEDKGRSEPLATTRNLPAEEETGSAP